MAIIIGSTVIQAQAQGSKIGYINSQELLTLMPGATKADTALAVYMRSLDAKYQTMAQEGQQKLQEYQSQQANWKAEIREAKKKELADLQERLQEFQSNAQDSLQAKRHQLFKPLLGKAQKAIEDVGKENGYDYILDGSALLYAKDTNDLMSKVKAKLGIK